MFNCLKNVVKTVSNNSGIISAFLPKALVALLTFLTAIGFGVILISPLMWLAAVISIVDNLNVNSLPKRRMCLCIGLIAWAILTLLFYNLDNIIVFCVALTLDASAFLYFLLKKLVFR